MSDEAVEEDWSEGFDKDRIGVHVDTTKLINNLKYEDNMITISDSLQASDTSNLKMSLLEPISSSSMVSVFIY